MKQSILLSSLFAASLVCASAAHAGSEIRKCIGTDGRVTLTDDACPGSTHTSTVVASSSDETAQEVTAPVAAARAEPERYAIARMPVRYVNLMKSSKPASGLSLDSATLRAARANMRLIDTMRGQRMASLQ